MKILKNWRKFNERLSEETLKSAEEKAREYGDEETADKLKKHNYFTKNRENTVNIYPFKFQGYKFQKPVKATIEGLDLNMAFDMWLDDPNSTLNLPFHLTAFLNEMTGRDNDGEILNMWITFNPYDDDDDFDRHDLHYKFHSVNFTDSEGEDAEFKFPIQDAKKAIKSFKKMIDKGIHRLPNEPASNQVFIESLEKISNKLNYRMLPLKK